MNKDKKKDTLILTKCKNGHEIRIRQGEDKNKKKCASCYNKQIKEYREFLFHNYGKK